MAPKARKTDNKDELEGLIDLAESIFQNLNFARQQKNIMRVRFFVFIACIYTCIIGAVLTNVEWNIYVGPWITFINIGFALFLIALLYFFGSSYLSLKHFLKNISIEEKVLIDILSMIGDFSKLDDEKSRSNIANAMLKIRLNRIKFSQE